MAPSFPAAGGAHPPTAGPIIPAPSSGPGGGLPLGGGGQPPGATALGGTARYTCLPSGHLSPANRTGWGGPHVTVGVRGLHASPVSGPLVLLMGAGGRRGARTDANVNANVNANGNANGDACGDANGDGDAAAAAHPFRVLPRRPSDDGLEAAEPPEFADELVAPQEFTVTAAVSGLCAGGFSASSEARSSTGSAPLVPVDLDPSLVGGCDPPPTCSATHVARFDPPPTAALPPSPATGGSAVPRPNHGEELTLPLRYRDLSRDAMVTFEVLCAGGFGGASGRRPVVARASLDLFDGTGRLRVGLQRLRLVPCVDGRPLAAGRAASEEDVGQGEDPLWEASLVLEGIRRTAEREALSRRAGRGRERPQLQGGADAEDATNPSAGGSAGVNLRGPNFALPNPSGPIPWLDAMTRQRCLDEIEAVRSQIVEEGRCGAFLHDLTLGVGSGGAADIPPAFLVVDLPDFHVPVVHEEVHYPPPAHGASGTVTAYDVSLYRRQQAKRKAEAGGSYEDYDAGLSLVQVLDYENTNDSHNPFEEKYRTLAHDLLRGHIDPTLKPSRAQRALLSEIISSPSRHPTNEERDLLWRFRFHLVDDRRALSKFLMAVDWSQPSEVVQAAELLEQWRSRSPIEVTDALRLLGKDVSDRAGVRHAGLVREYAIETLDKAEDGELRLYLLQLVQAIKYEAEEDDGEGGDTDGEGARRSPKRGMDRQSRSLASFLIDRASRNLELANYLYWYLQVEIDQTDSTHGTHYRAVFDALKEKLSRSRPTVSGADIVSKQRDGLEGAVAMGTNNSSVQSSSYSVKSALRGMKKMGKELGSSLLHHAHASDHHSPRSHGASGGGISMWDVLCAQERLISGLMECQRKARDARGKKDAKEQFLRDALAAEGYDRIDSGLVSTSGPSVPLPSAPSVMVTGVRPESTIMFKSALYPAVIEFNVGDRTTPSTAENANGKDIFPTRFEIADVLAGTDNDAVGSAAKIADDTFKVIFKTGDDLRQDQLVIMMIQLMDRLLKRATLDMCLKPYAILATTPNTGLVEFVDNSVPISQVLANNSNSILQYFQAAAPKLGSKYGIDPDVMQTYLRSCAGYCVITYLLGVGDRHLDNIMLQASGHFFHIDFGFIFGRDPKPLPPAFRLTREMVDGMGGVDSAEYGRFRSLSCQAFNTLRKSAGLVMNLLHLMGDAGIEDLSNNPAADAEGVISKVEERFRLELTDEQAEAYFLGLIDDSLSALAPRVMEVFHQLSVARR